MKAIKPISNSISNYTALEWGERAAYIPMKNIKRRMLVAIAGILGLACNGPSSGSLTKTASPFIPLNKGEASANYNAAVNLIETHQGVTYINHKIANGTVFLLDAKKDTLLFENYKHGKPDGIAYRKYENGQPEYVQHFVNGKMEGMQRRWWENGNLKQQAEYSNDVFDGILKEWNEEGKLMRDNNYVKGHEAGKQRMWYDNGKLRANYLVKDGRMYGLTGTMNCYNAVEKSK